MVTPAGRGANERLLSVRPASRAGRQAWHGSIRQGADPGRFAAVKDEEIDCSVAGSGGIAPGRRQCSPWPGHRFAGSVVRVRSGIARVAGR